MFFLSELTAVRHTLIKRAALLAVVMMLTVGVLFAHPVSFNSTVTYSSTQPAGGADSIANWTGAAFDAANIGGSGVNADGGANNGTANDAYTYVANNQPRQGQTFTTGSNPDGYQLTAVTARMAGYTNNNATGDNQSAWDLNAHNGPVQVEIGRVSGTDITTLTKQMFIMGRAGTPGTGRSANGAGTYITFHLPFTTYLEPNTTYSFDFWVGNGSNNYFEWLGTQTDAYAGGTAYNRDWWGGPITPLAGERVFELELTALEAPAPAFAHPGTLHTQADLDRMKAKVAAQEEPWLSGYQMLLSSPYNNLGWPAYNVDYIVRGTTGNNYTRSQQDAQLIYTQALIWHVTGNTAYANRAVEIANVWSDLIGIQGDTNASLAAGICGYLFASAGELLSTYPGWAEADKQAYKDMMMRVFYPANFDFLWRHHDTPWSKGGNTHYRLNWDTANMASMAAIGILCDNRAVYEQAVDYFKYGPGNGRVERAGWYLHPGGLGQGEEAGRDQGHNLGGWHAMALLCQMAWNQGDDLFGYDNNRVLRVFEYNAKYNLWNDVPYTPHRNTSLTYTEGTVSGAGRGLGYYQYELVYNHYANVKGIASPWSSLAAHATRPEPWPNTALHPSQVDWFGLGTLTYTQEPITTDQAPSGLRANWSKNRVILDWWGPARASGYRVKRAVSAGGPYTQIGTVTGTDMNFTDTNVDNGTTYYYIVTAATPSGDLDSTPLRVARELVVHYPFEGHTEDVIGGQNAARHGGSTGLPGYAAGFGGGQAIDLDGVDDYLQLPAGTANFQDMTVAAWVRWDGGGNWQRIFDFGSDIDKNLFLTPSNGGSSRFHITPSRGTDGSGTLDGSILPTGQWVHLAVSLNGDVGTYYINGKPEDTKVIDQVDPLFGQPYCYIGKSMWNADPLFNGRIDDFRIYNYGLSGDEIWNLWGQSANHAPVFSSDPIDKLADEDVPFTGQTLAAHASDADGNPLSFSKLNGPAWLSVASNGALSGTPGNDDVGSNTFMVRVTDSISATDDAVLRITVANVNDAPFWSDDSYTLDTAASEQFYSVSVADLADDMDPGDTLTFSKVVGPAWLSVSANGTLSGTPGTADVGTNQFVIRVTDASGQYADAVFNVRIYGLPVKVYYKFEKNLDDSVGRYHAVATGDPEYTPGPYCEAVDLDGIDDYVTLPAGVADTADITIAAWVNWDGGGQWQRIFDFGNNTTQYMFLTPRSGDNTLRFAITTAGNGSEQKVEAGGLTIGQWVHLAVTLEDDTGKLFVNGVLADSNASMTLNPSDFNPGNNYIGKSQWPDPLFDGRIDDFRIYHYALSPGRIAELADMKMNTDDLSILVSWWLWLTTDCGEESECLTMDINGDQKIDLLDFLRLASRWMKNY
jgi:hypothetical protein